MSMSPPPNPYKPHKVQPYDLDLVLSMNKNSSNKDLEAAKKYQGRLACVNTSSRLKDDYLRWVVNYYEVEGIWAL